MANQVSQSQVTSQDDSTIKTYTIVVNQRSADASLSKLELSPGSLTPVFDSNIREYTATVVGETVRVTAEATHENATIKINDEDMARGQLSQEITLSSDAPTTITIVVTAEDATTKRTYTIVVQSTTGIRIRSKIFLEGPLQ